jgi:serine/threonine protein kinase
VADRYRLRSQLGGGGMGAVWLARDELLGRDVAVKQVLVPAGIDAALAQANRDAAMREGRIAARLSHPHAVAVYDMVLDGGQPWLVMEHLPSVSLAALLHDRRVLPIVQVAQIGAQVADALAATHAAGVIHRDVKPGNILIGEGPGREGLVKITDFGISRAVGDVSLTQTGVVKGTPAFLAPEVAQGSPPDEASDVFSLGATLYACLEGSPPFGLSDNALQMLYKVAGGEFQPPTQAGALTAPLMRMLAADPTQRPTMTQVRDELAKLAAGPDRDVTEVLTARTLLPKTLPGLPARAKAAATAEAESKAGSKAGTPPRRTTAERVPIAPPTPAPPAPDPPASTPPVPAPRPTSGSQPAPASVRAEPTARQPRPAAAPTSPPATRNRPRWPAALAAVLVLGGLAALLVFWLTRPDERDDTAGDPASSSAPAPAPSAETSAAPDTPTPSTAPSVETTPGTTASPTSPTADSPPTAAEMVQFVTDYYGLLPGDPAAAYERTGPTLRGIISRDGYIGFWSDYESVTLGGTSADEAGLVVNAQVTLVRDDETFPEQHRIQLVEGSDGQLLVDSDVPV